MENFWSQQQFPGRAAFALLLLVASVALFWRLDGALLWRDEATTANWARTMVAQRSLTPTAFDGKTLAAQGFDAHDFNSDLSPGMQGWLQFYVTAASFRLFGVSTYTARLPFAFCGLLGVCVLWLIGRRLYGNSPLALLFPALAITSIWYLTIFRQSRYYGLVFLFSALLFYEFVRYLQDRQLARRLSWYLRVSLWAAGVYLAHYLGFAGLYAALCLFVLLSRDRELFWRWSVMTVILGVIFGAEFLTFHFDFASSWGAARQPWEEANATILDRLEGARRMHQEELLRMLPLLFLIPGLFYVLRRREASISVSPAESVSPHSVAPPLAPAVLLLLAGAVTWLGRGWEYFGLLVAAVVLALAFLGYRFLQARRSHAPAAKEVAAGLFWLLPVGIAMAIVMSFATPHTREYTILHAFAEVLIAGLFVFAILRLRPQQGAALSTTRGVALLGVLVMVVSVAVTIGIGLDKGLPRYYYQTLMASMVLAALVSAELLRWRKMLGWVFVAGLAIWPNLSYYVYANFAIVERQFERNRAVDVPVIEFLRNHAQPGDRFVVYRNVQGMMLHFYLPELHWVGQLDANHLGAARFRDRLPGTAYDTVEDVAWYLVWNNYGIQPKGLDDRYEKVWEYDYEYPMSVWDRVRGVHDARRWTIYKRKGLDRGVNALAVAVTQ